MVKLLILSSLFVVFLLLPTTNYPLQTTYGHSQTQIIEMTPDGFSPDPVTIDINSTIIFLNKDIDPRWPASNVHPTHELYPEFDSKKGINPGESWVFKPQKIGDFKYHDHLFSHMRGTIKVVAEPGAVNEITKPFTFPHSMWEATLEKIKKTLNQLFSNFKTKQSKLPVAGEFKVLSYPQQEKTVRELVDAQGAQKAWEFVKETFKGAGGSSGNIHDLAHLSGSLLFNNNGFEGLSSCSKEFSFGCYHGFLDTAFSKNLDHLDNAYNACLKLGPANSGPAASCIHGIGHGIASYFSTTDIKKSLTTCRKLTSGQEFCFDGVFMEFVRSAPTSFFKQEDLLYPCNQLEKEFGYAYSFACGRNQPSLLMGRFNKGFDEVASICLNADSKPFKEACFDSLGFSVTSTGNVDQIIASCQKVTDVVYSKRCIQAAAGELVFQEIPGWREKSRAVCSNILENQNECLEYVDRLISEYQRN